MNNNEVQSTGQNKYQENDHNCTDDKQQKCQNKEVNTYCPHLWHIYVYTIISKNIYSINFHSEYAKRYQNTDSNGGLHVSNRMKKRNGIHKFNLLPTISMSAMAQHGHHDQLSTAWSLDTDNYHQSFPPKVSSRYEGGNI